MVKKIVIPDCSVCPHQDHKGAFGKVAYVPVCRKTARANNTLPYTVGEGHGLIIADPTEVIPDWCPLENNDA